MKQNDIHKTNKRLKEQAYSTSETELRLED